MNQLRFWIIGIFVWFLILSNLERLGSIDIALQVYILAGVSAALIILLPPMQRIPFYGQLFLVLMPYLILRIIFGYDFLGMYLSTTIIEIFILGMTIYLISQVGRQLESFQEAVTRVTIGQLTKGTQSFEPGQGRIYSEIRRARHYQRPAALLAISVTDESIKYSLNRFIQEAQQGIMRRYINARLASLLIDELRDVDVVTQRNDHFVMLLPEINQENIMDVVNRLQVAAREKLGVSLKIGHSTFPDEAVTFETLLDRAESDMKISLPPDNSEAEDAAPHPEGALQV